MMELDRIYNEDCLDGMKRIPDCSVDAVICDLPYGTTDCAWDSVIPLDKLWEQYERILKPKGTCVMFAQQPFTSLLVCSRIDLYRHTQTWIKDKAPNFIAARYQPQKSTEDIIVFSKGGFAHNSNPRATYNPQMAYSETTYSQVKKSLMSSHKSSNQIRNRPSNNEKYFFAYEKEDEYSRFPRNYIYVPTPNGDERFHPTQKPVDLLRYLVLTYTNEGDTVLDNCSGSGTTAVACVKEKRHFICFELNEEYYRKACERIDNEKRQLTLF